MGILKDKIVFITGASSGIGKACATEFAHEGAKLILTARRKERLKELADSLLGQYGTESIILSFDIRNYKEVKKAYDSLPDNWKQIDILVNNAGLARGLARIHEGDITHWDEMIDTNVKGLLYVTRLVTPIMAERESGHIVNIGSIAGHQVYVNGNVYNATKFAVNALNQAIRLDLLEKNIKVTSIDPGMVETEFSLVRFSGDETRAKSVYSGLKALCSEDVADAVIYAVTRPPHVNINEIILTPIAQGSVSQILRK